MAYEKGCPEQPDVFCEREECPCMALGKPWSRGTPTGNLLTPAMLSDVDVAYEPARAFREGANAYLLGAPEAANPYRELAADPMGEPRLHREWRRGYRNARQRDRFNATIRARRAGAVDHEVDFHYHRIGRD